MKNLIAYIPTLNRRHLDWFGRHPQANLHLISQDMAERLLPRLGRNMAALPTDLVKRTIVVEGLASRVRLFDPEDDEPQLSHRSGIWKKWILPDEDISHLVAEEYLEPAGCEVSYEMIWARWDMKAVERDQPVIPDVEISTDAFHIGVMGELQILSDRGPDWWRRIGAATLSSDGRVATAHNTYLPNEYEVYIFGDPRINNEAGQVGKYASIHAEQAVISQCARYGLTLGGGVMYVTTFPCEICARMISFSGISTLYFLSGYSSLNAQEVLRAYGVRIIQVKDSLVSV